jgi:hypothetical protein
MIDDAIAIRKIRDWLEKFVIGLNLCPFAAKPFNEDRIGFTVCAASDRESIYRAILIEADKLINTPQDKLETSLLILTEGLKSFDAYLELLAEADAAFSEAGLDGTLQIASFHPDYVFGQSEAEDPANYSNRSPFPLFHILRETSLENALQHYPHPERIPQRNIEKLRELGIAEIQNLFLN